MRIKRFFAPDIRQAIKLVREELGSDAVILSNRSVEGGVEIVSAIDYDEALVRNMSGNLDDTGQNNANRIQRPEENKAQILSFRQSGEKQSDVRDNAATREPEATPERPAEPNRFAAAQEGSGGERPKVVWSQDPALTEMRKELKNLRGLLETQLSGLAWSDVQRRYPLYAELLQRLMKLGLSVRLAKEVADSISGDGDMDHMWRMALGVLASRIPVTDDDIISGGGVVALVGPTGVGKTTTIAKLAARYALRHGPRHVALVTTDNYRIGAHEQLRAYSRILDIPMRVATSEQELNAVIDDMFDRRLILVDTAGMSPRDLRLPEQLALLKANRNAIRTYLVLSSNTRLSALEDTVRVYEDSPVDGCILTKLDETTSLGSALSAVIAHQLPVAYVSDGQRVPEDLHAARAHTLVNRSATIMADNEALLEDEALPVAVGRAIANAPI